MDTPAAAGAPQMGSIMTPEGRRRSARLAAKAELTEGANAITDDMLAEAVADAIVGAEEIAGPLKGGKRHKLRGGSKTWDAIKNLVKSAISGGGGIVGLVDSAIGATIGSTAGALKIVGAVGVTVAVLNHPTMIGNLAKLCASVLKTGANTAITSTWGDWGRTIAALGESVKTLGSGLAEQTVQGPVVPVAVAVAILTWYANKTGKSVTEILKSSASKFSSTVSGFVQEQIAAGKTAFDKESYQTTVGQLKTLAKRAKVPTSGKGAQQMKMSALSSGAPAATGTAAGIGLVPGSTTAQAGDFKAALEPIVGMEPSGEGPGAELDTPEKKEEAFVDGLDLLAAIAAAESPVATTVAPPPAPAAAPSYVTRVMGEPRDREAEFQARKTAEMDQEREQEKKGRDRRSRVKRGGGKTRGKKSKRRVTRRKARVVKFAY